MAVVFIQEFPADPGGDRDTGNYDAVAEKLSRGPSPDGLIVPMIAAIIRAAGLAVFANTTPAIAIMTAPAISMRRRPIRSAMVVISTVITAPPASAAVKMPPMVDSRSPRLAR